MGRRSRRRQREPSLPPAEYTAPGGDVLALRTSMTAPSRAGYLAIGPEGADRPEDAEARRREFLFERLAVNWTIAGLEPIRRQDELLARYRMSSGAQRAWVDSTLREHVAEHFPELQG